MKSDNGVPGIGLENMRGLDRCSFNRWNASSHSSVHLKALLFLRHWKNGVALLPENGKNLDNAAILPVNFCTSLTEVGLSISRIALTCLG